MARMEADDIALARARVREGGFTFVPGSDMRPWLEAGGALAKWEVFAASWDVLGPDVYLASRGRQRQRRHAVYYASADGSIRREPDQPHFQSLAYNPLQGGIERWFEPVLPAIGESRELRAILAFGLAFFAPLAAADVGWRIEVHQFRIEPGRDSPGEPTPEGVHRDGVDFVLVLMIDRHNIASGTTTIHDATGRQLGSFTLAASFDAALLDDHRVFHGVTPVEAVDPRVRSHRDVLVVTYRAMGAA
jgi:hypothetical protein